MLSPAHKCPNSSRQECRWPAVIRALPAKMWEPPSSGVHAGALQHGYCSRSQFAWHTRSCEAIITYAVCAHTVVDAAYTPGHRREGRHDKHSPPLLLFPQIPSPHSPVPLRHHSLPPSLPDCRRERKRVSRGWRGNSRVRCRLREHSSASHRHELRHHAWDRHRSPASCASARQAHFTGTEIREKRLSTSLHSRKRRNQGSGRQRRSPWLTQAETEIYLWGSWRRRYSRTLPTASSPRRLESPVSLLFVRLWAFVRVSGLRLHSVSLVRYPAMPLCPTLLAILTEAEYKQSKGVTGGV